MTRDAIHGAGAGVMTAEGRRVLPLEWSEHDLGLILRGAPLDWYVVGTSSYRRAYESVEAANRAAGQIGRRRRSKPPVRTVWQVLDGIQLGNLTHLRSSLAAVFTADTPADVIYDWLMERGVPRRAIDDVIRLEAYYAGSVGGPGSLARD